MADEPRLRRGGRRPSAGSGSLEAFAPDVALVARGGGRPGRQPRLPPSAARRRVGGARRPPGGDRHRRADRRGHHARGPISSRCPPTGCWRWRRPPSARTPVACTAGSPRRSPTGRTSTFWVEARDATRADDDSTCEWIAPLGAGARRPRGLPRSARCGSPGRVSGAGAEPESWRADALAHPPSSTRRPTTGSGPPCSAHARWPIGWSPATGSPRPTRVLAGAGVANLAAWFGVQLARDRGAPTVLTAELGLLGYEPTPADPFVFNHRAFPSATLLADADAVLGTLVPGPGTRCVACLGAAQIDARRGRQLHRGAGARLPRRLRRGKRRGLHRR